MGREVLNDIKIIRLSTGSSAIKGSSPTSVKSMTQAAFKIKENSFVAKMAAKKLKASSVAMVLGKTIHLYGSTKENFLSNEKWLRHELCHVQQFREHGYLPFIAKYLWESARRGYRDNKFEVAARAAEHETTEEPRGF